MPYSPALTPGCPQHLHAISDALPHSGSHTPIAAKCGSMPSDHCGAAFRLQTASGSPLKNRLNI
ncbi:hypothetical protein [Neisseria maigaei]|uniref:hypothetical protein n=1 Tax=Neisseria maigaei TaxID=2830651 RepID=UPI00265A96C7|nr:hypothetical protein [Neisseria maigaei]